jgi:acyl carrier protein
MKFHHTKTDEKQSRDHLSVEARLARIWQDVLGLNEPPNINDDFFDLGGNSLLATQVVSRITLDFDKTLSLREFFFNPSIVDLGEVLKQIDSSSPVTVELKQTETEAASPTPWELPVKIFHKLNNMLNSWRPERTGIEAVAAWGLPMEIFQQIKTFVSRWDGEHVNPDSLIVGRNTEGTRPPLFWVFQGELEFLQLARQLGEDQPLYGMRSGHLVMDYTENNIQALALNYVDEIQKLHPEGPLMIGGNCQGGLIALVIAQHLLRRQRHVPLLILMEWAFSLQPYTGRIALIFGSESEFANPWLRFQYPELAWQRAFSDYQVEVTSGRHGKFFNDSNVQTLATIVSDCMEQAIGRAPEHLPAEAMYIGFELVNPPAHLLPGTRAHISVRVTNRSPVHWNGGDRSGLMLVNQWKQKNGDVLQKKDGHIFLPPLAPGESCNLDLPVTAPLHTGESLLVVQAVEEGVGWFDADASTVQCAILLVEPTPEEQ